MVNIDTLLPWGYNSCRVMTRLATLVRAEGGTVKPNRRTMIYKRESSDKTPLSVTHTSYISFVLDNMFYYFQVDDNPLFEFWYIKTPVLKGNQRDGDACIDETSKAWLTDNIISNYECSDEEINKSAKVLLRILKNAKVSVTRPEVGQLKVPNTYNDGYHIEVVTKRRKVPIWK